MWNQDLTSNIMKNIILLSFSINLLIAGNLIDINSFNNDIENQTKGKVHEAQKPLMHHVGKYTLQKLAEAPKYVDKSFKQNDRVRSNVASDTNSKGSVSSLCFNINNTLELDNNDRLVIKNVRDTSYKTDSKGFFGDKCINAYSPGRLGGEYIFSYYTDNRIRTGNFTISGNYPIVNLELSNDNWNKDKFYIRVTEKDY